MSLVRPLLSLTRSSSEPTPGCRWTTCCAAFDPCGGICVVALARRKPLDPKPLDVNVLLHGLAELLNRSLGETIEVEILAGAGLWCVEADASELESALLNLAVNARDAMPLGGKITLATANVCVDDRYPARHDGLSAGEYVSISMADTGSGMDADTLSRAFEPFFTTKAVGKGTGLGLGQVYGFVTQSGGHVDICSELGAGTTIRIHLPRLHGTQAQCASAGAHDVLRKAGRETVLVVEDDDAVRALSVDGLTKLGYEVVEASDGPSAMKALEARPRIDLLFTDVVLPGGMDGVQVAASAEARTPELKVLFTTGYSRDAIGRSTRLDNDVHLLTKPYTFAELARKVSDVSTSPKV